MEVDWDSGVLAQPRSEPVDVVAILPHEARSAPDVIAEFAPVKVWQIRAKTKLLARKIDRDLISV